MPKTDEENPIFKISTKCVLFVLVSKSLQNVALIDQD